MSVLIFLVVLCVLILVHEWGHFIAAKKLGMRVDEFAIGFPPRIFSKQVGETLYSFNVFLIGGFVKIFGEDGTSVPSSPVVRKASDGRYERSETGRGGEDPTAVGYGTDPRSFSAKPKWAQGIVLIAGVTMNVVLAWALFCGVLIAGTQSAVSETERTSDTPLIVTEVLPESPADEAGITVGDRVLGVAGVTDKLTDITPSSFQTFIALHGNEPITFTYEAKGEIQTVTITPEENLLEGEPERRAVGIALAFIKTESLPPLEAFVEATAMTGTGLYEITIGLGSLLWDAVHFDANLQDIAGPVGIVGLVGEASAFGLTTLLMFTAFISLNLAVINLLPFPALDGGRLLFVVIEAIKGSPIKPSWAGTLNTIGFALLIALMLAVTYNDILKIL